MESNSDSVGQRLCAEAASLRQQWKDDEKITKALSIFQEAAEKFSNLWMAHYGLGEILLFRASRSSDESKLHKLRNEGLCELRKAVDLEPTHPEPLLKLAGELALPDPTTAKDFYERAIEGLEAHSETLYPGFWQAGNHWAFAIGAAESGYEDLSIDAFCRAISLREHYATMYSPSLEKAIVCWKRALKKLGRNPKKWWQIWK